MNIKISLFLVAVCISSLEAKGESKKQIITAKEPVVEVKGKREAAIGHYGPPRATNHLHLQPASGSFSIGAGYSLGEGGGGGGYSSPSFVSSHSFGGNSISGIDGSSFHGPSSHGGYISSPPSHNRYTSISGTYKNPNTQPSITSISGGHSQPAVTYGVPSFGSVVGKPHLTYGPPGYTSGSHGHSSLPSYAAGHQGLGAYASHGGFSKPLFVPAGDVETPHISYGPPPSFGGHGIFGGGYSSYKSPYSSSFGPPHGFGGKYTAISSHYRSPSKKPFKPSVFLGASISSPASTYGAPSISHGPSSSYGPPSSIVSSPIYLGPKVISGISHSSEIDSNSLGSFSDGSHGSPSLSGSHYLPSAGHAAPAISFKALHGNYEAPSSSYGAPIFGHGSSSSPAYLVSSHISHPSSSHSFGGHESSNYLTPAATYGVPVVTSERGYSGGQTYEGIGSGQLELPSPHSPKSFIGAESGNSYTGSYTSGHESNGYDSSDTYGAPSETNYQVQASPNTYDTIKFSKSLPVDEPPKNQ